MKRIVFIVAFLFCAFLFHANTALATCSVHGYVCYVGDAKGYQYCWECTDPNDYIPDPACGACDIGGAPIYATTTKPPTTTTTKPPTTTTIDKSITTTTDKMSYYCATCLVACNYDPNCIKTTCPECATGPGIDPPTTTTRGDCECPPKCPYGTSCHCETGCCECIPWSANDCLGYRTCDKPPSYAECGIVTVGCKIIYDAPGPGVKCPDPVPDGTKAISLGKCSTPGTECVENKCIIPPSSTTTTTNPQPPTTTSPYYPPYYPPCTVASNGDKYGDCNECYVGGDNKCGTFSSTQTCDLTHIIIYARITNECTPNSITNSCTVTDKQCVDTTKTCINKQCVDPTTTTTTTTKSTTTTTSNDSTTTTTSPANCPGGQINPHFICESNGCKQINACGVNSGGCTQSGGICGLLDGHTYLSLIIGLDGIGSTGDNQNPEDINCTIDQRQKNQCGSNWNPLKTNRDINVELLTDTNTPASTYSSQINFTPVSTNSGKFTGAVDLGTSFTSGGYIVKAKSSGYLKREFPSIQTITIASTDGPPSVNTLPTIRKVTGNVDQNTSLDIRDYNILMSCSIFSTDNNGACNQNNNYKIWSDLEDNGAINELDYNLFMREWVNQHEQ